MKKSLVLLFLTTLSFSEAYSITPWIPLYSIPIFIAVFYKRKVPVEFIRYITILLIPLIIQVIFNYNSKTPNYFLFYITVFFIYPVGINNLIRSIDIMLFKRYLIIGFVFTGMFVILEFCSNVFGLHIQDYIIRERETSATLAGFYRSYGFSSEPGSLSYFLNSLGPISIYVSKRKTLIYLIYSLSILFTLSPVGIFIWLLYSLKFQKQYFTKAILSLLSLFLIYFFIRFKQEIILIKEAFRFKLSGGGTSSLERIDALSYFLGSIYSNPLGHGLGYTTSIGLTSPKNFFIFSLYEIGAIGIMCIIVPLYFIFSRFNSTYKYFTILSLLHLLFISQIQYPYTIFLFCFFLYQVSKQDLVNNQR